MKKLSEQIISGLKELNSLLKEGKTIEQIVSEKNSVAKKDIKSKG